MLKFDLHDTFKTLTTFTIEYIEIQFEKMEVCRSWL